MAPSKLINSLGLYEKHQWARAVLIQKGRNYFEELMPYSPYDFPFECCTCRNMFAAVQDLIDHRKRKHSHIVPMLPLWLPKFPWRQEAA